MPKDQINIEKIKFPYCFSHQIAGSYGPSDEKSLDVLVNLFPESIRISYRITVKDETVHHSGDLWVAIQAYNNL